MAKKDNSARYLDKRTAHRWVEKGRVSQADVDAHMKGLPDLEGKYDDIADLVYQGESPEPPPAVTE